MAVSVLLIVLAGAIAFGSLVGSSAAPSTQRTPMLAIAIGQRTILRVPIGGPQRLDPSAMRRLLRERLPQRTVVRQGRAQIGFRLDVEQTVRRATRRTLAGRIQANRIRESSMIDAPVIRQAQPNTCEAAALAIMLASTGVSVSQQRLQAGFPRSGPVDPLDNGPERIWGDPDRGYVGRAKGGGVAGGFGIYPGPVAATARSYDRVLEDLTASEPSRIYSWLLTGRAVIAWIGLSDGPYATWLSPQGKRIDVNFGEHTIVLTGVTREGDLRVINPLEGTLERWSRPRFEAAWQLLDRRALGAPA